MSTCISYHGEFSSHRLNADYVCTFCGVLDEDALISELQQARAAAASLTTERDRLRGGNANLISNAEILADELIHASAERDTAQALLVEEQRDHAATREELALAEQFGIDQTFNALDSQAVIDVLIYHYRDNIKGCACGWSRLGHSHAGHVLGEIVVAVRGALPSPTPGNEDHPSGTSAAPGEERRASDG